MLKAQKEEIVKSLTDNLDQANALFMSNLIGVTSNQANDVRKAIRNVGGKVVIAKNTLFKRAAANTKHKDVVFNMVKDLKGTNALVFAFKDVAAVAKALKEAGKDNDLVTYKMGVMDGKVLTSKDISVLADLPSREQMLATMLATMLAPISALVRVLDKIKTAKEAS